MFCNKYSPKTIESAYFNKDEINKVIRMTKDDAIPHIIFYGPEGSGKKTCINFFLKSLYGDKVTKLVSVPYTFTTSSNTAQTIDVMQSDFHIVIEPSSVNSDKHLVQNVIKEYAKRTSIVKSNKIFRTIYINNIDSMSYYAQTSLRRTLEQYSNRCRFVMWSRTLCKVIPPLLSRCYCFAIKSPSRKQMLGYILDIANKENIDLSLKNIVQILNKADGNIKLSLWLLEYTKLGISYNTTYDTMLHKICENIFDPRLSSLIEIRQDIYTIIITNINGNKIVKDILDKIIIRPELDISQVIKIVDIASKLEFNFTRGRHEIMHIEPFINGIKGVIFGCD